nr:NADH dehydrogenase subunit 4 [Manota sp. WQY001]
MLKFVFYLLFMMPLCLLNKKYWMVQNLIFLLSFMFMFMNFNLYWMNVSYMFGMDFLSFGLILLCMWISALMLMSSEMVYFMKNFYSLFMFLIIFMLLLLLLTFSIMHMLMFYLFFESSLIPTFLLILGWGYQPERIQAGMYLLFYTLIASLPLLLSILYLYNLNKTLMFDLLEDKNLNVYFYLMLVLAFMVKLPIYFFHLWLPKAHVEAPVAGSMILAGILLKLGGYGLLRLFKILISSGISFNYFFLLVSIMGGFFVSLICLRQVDIKSLIAYSSVAHMSLVLGGILSLFSWGISGSYLMMIAHGLCSSGMFCLANISYERTHSRSLLINKGLMNFMPSMALWWFLLSATNMAAPPSLNLLSEIFLLNSLIGWSSIMIGILSLLSFFSAAYTLYLYSYSQHGKLSLILYSYYSGSEREFLILFLHWLPLNLLILKSDYFLLWI